MPKLKIDGVGTIQVDDSFTKLSPDDQNAFVAHVADQARQGVKSGGGGAVPSTGAQPSTAPRLGMSADVSDPSDVSALMPGDSKGVPLLPGLAHGANDAVGAVFRGIPFADRAASAVRAITPGSGRFGDYSGALQDERADATRAAAEHPTGEKVGNLTGGGLSAVALMPSFYGQLMAKTAGLAGGGAAPLLARTLAMAKDGALQGAAQGASSAPDLTDVKDVARRTAGDAAAGSLIGGVAPVAGAGIGAATSFFSKPVPGSGRVASGLLGNLISPETEATLGKLGPDATLADASPSLLGLAQGVAARPGAGADKITRFVDARQAGQADRLLADRNTNLGPAFSPTEIAGQLDAKRANLLPLLAQADAAPSIWNASFDGLAQRPAMQKALRTASDTAANEGRPLPMVSLDEAGREVSPAARQAYEGYAANAGQHVDNALGELLGKDGALAKSDELIAARKAAADPLYAEFRAGNVPMTDDLAKLLKRPSVKGALPAAERLAQDEGKTIYVKSPGEDGIAPIGGDDSRPFTPLEAYDEAQTARPTKPDVPRPQDLHGFVKSLGGVQDPKGDLKAMGLDAVPGLIAKDGKGLGPDAVRQAAAEAGYLGADTDAAMSDTTINHLFDALSHDRPVHSVYDDEAVHRWAGYDQARGEFDRSGSRNGGPAGPNAPGFPDPGPDAPPVRQITPEGWDYVKRALDDKISTAQRGGSGNEARVYTGLKGELTDALDAAVPVYKQARQVFAGHAALSDALEAGQNAVKTGVSREQVQREFGALGTDGEKHLYRLGMANGLREMVARRPNGPNVVAPLATRQVSDKLAAVAPSPEALAQFQRRVAETGKTFTDAQRPDNRGMRYALDQLRAMQAKATGDQARAIGETAGAVTDQLGTIPAFARADLGARAADRGQAAFDLGRGVLRQTDNAPTPADLARAFAKLPLEQQALLRAGTRSDIEQRFGQNPNDLSAAKRVVGGDHDFNRGNMETLFGPRATQAMVDAVAREQAFAATRNAITAGSRTAPMQAGKEMIDAATAPKQPFFPKDTSLLGLLLNSGEALTRKGTEALSQAAGGKAREQLGGLLSLTGPARDRILAEVLAAQAGRARSAGRAADLLSVPVLPAGLLAGRGRDR